MIFEQIQKLDCYGSNIFDVSNQKCQGEWTINFHSSCDGMLTCNDIINNTEILYAMMTSVTF